MLEAPPHRPTVTIVVISNSYFSTASVKNEKVKHFFEEVGLFVRTAINVLFISAKAVHSEANGQTNTLPDWLWQQTCFSSRPLILSLCFVIVEEPEEVEVWTRAHASGPEGFSH